MSLHMRLVKSEDFYSIKVRGYVTALHLDVLDVLYQPIIGFAATSLYRYLYATREFRSGSPLSFTLLHNHLGFTYDQLSMAFNRLEGVGLVRSYLVTHDAFNEFIFEIYAPKDPAAFSHDAIFMNLLQDVVGPRHAQDILSIFKLDSETHDKEEVSSDFAAIYGPQIKELNGDELYTGKTLDNVIADVKIPFDEALFFNILTSKRMILPSALSKNEVKVLMQIAGLFGLTEDALAAKVGEYYDPDKAKGSRVDIEGMRVNLRELVKYPSIFKSKRRQVEKLHGDSEEILVINKMESMASVDFLVMLNKGTKIAPADYKILDDLVHAYNLKPPIVNALIFHTLKNNNQQLIRALIEKNASLLVRSKAQNALDALDILEKPFEKRGRKSKPVKEEAKEEAKEEVKNDLDDPIWEKLKDL